MKSINNNKSNKRLKWMKYFGLNKSFLLIIVFTMAFFGCHDDITEPETYVESPDDIISDPETVVGSEAPSSAISSIFGDLGHAVSHEIAVEGVGWVMGALGLAGESPDYGAAIKLIEADLEEIIQELAAIEQELQAINQELLVLDCDEQQTALAPQIGRINFLLLEYKTFISVANNGLQNSNADLENWVDQVLAEGDYTSQTPIGQILSTMAAELLAPNSGAIVACVKSVQHPQTNSFDDTQYYDQVSHFTNYYYYFQTQALMMYVEALHYKAWIAAGSPVDMGADNVEQVCIDQSGGAYCIQASNAVNTTYNSLVNQYTAGGAPYTNDDFLMQNNGDEPRLWVRSLEDFSGCGSPLTSEVSGDIYNDPYPCGVTSGFWNSPLSWAVHFKGYTDWGLANSTELKNLINGWSSGTAGQYLESARGFKLMTHKLIIANNTVSIKLDHAPSNQDFVPHIDTDFNHSFMGGVVDNKGAFQKFLNRSDNYQNCSESSATEHVWTSKQLPTSLGSRNSYWANVHAYSDGCHKYSMTWDRPPGWLSSNTANKSRQYRWPRGNKSLFTNHATNGRSTKNVGGKWTMCGEDFTTWLEQVVPKPPTCSDLSLIPCH